MSLCNQLVMWDYFDQYEGQIKYLHIPDQEHLVKMLEGQKELVGFDYGDGLFKLKMNVFNGILCPSNLEQLILMLKRISDHAEKTVDLKMILSDAYEIQSVEPTAMKKGAVLKSLASIFKICSRRWNWTFLLISETECSITRRQIG